MNLRFLGTGSLDTVRVRNKFSKDYRRFPTLLIDDRILIDPSADIFEFEESFMLSGLFDTVSDVFITHSHLDHFSITAIEALAAKRKINVYATECIIRELNCIDNVNFTVISPFMLVKIGNYSVIPLPSNHATENHDEIPLNFIIQADKTLFYALDGAFINPDAWRVLKELKIDVAVLDCDLDTQGYTAGCVNHNNLDMAEKIKQILLASSVANESTKFILSHIKSSKKRSIHEELSEAADSLGFRTAYDGYYLGL